ncbi:TetR family transcriptional regulator [Streptomyces sp. NPDC093018]|uniref:TetR/AcrR family transcriptional regulator n=1 Tax=Streptomyces sp. NPDC093018 TaxID=3155067 RepID=UPI0034363C70
MARQNADQRREAVLRAAVTEFGRFGQDGASTTAIAQGAGISQGYLFRLFPQQAGSVPGGRRAGLPGDRGRSAQFCRRLPHVPRTAAAIRGIGVGRGSAAPATARLFRGVGGCRVPGDRAARLRPALAHGGRAHPGAGRGGPGLLRSRHAAERTGRARLPASHGAGRAGLFVRIVGDGKPRGAARIATGFVRTPVPSRTGPCRTAVRPRPR